MGNDLPVAENLPQVIGHVATQAHSEEDLRVGDETSLVAVEAQADEAAAELWRSTEGDLQQIPRSPEELG